MRQQRHDAGAHECQLALQLSRARYCLPLTSRSSCADVGRSAEPRICVLGGFTPVSWQSGDGEGSSILLDDPTRKTFVFSLTNEHNRPLKFKMQVHSVTAIDCNQVKGLGFGKSFLLCDDEFITCGTSQTRSRFGVGESSGRLAPDFAIDENFITGARLCCCQELEVFSLSLVNEEASRKRLLEESCRRSARSQTSETRSSRSGRGRLVVRLCSADGVNLNLRLSSTHVSLRAESASPSLVKPHPSCASSAMSSLRSRRHSRSSSHP